jgi:outer membrane protein
MKKILILIYFFILLIQNVNAETFSQALLNAYKNNPELNAERENIKISEQELKISLSSYFPSVTLSGSKSDEDTDKLTNQSGGDTSIDDVNTLTKSIIIKQTLVDFGRGAEFKKSKIGIDLAKAKLLKKEQDILYKAAEAYTGIILANEKLEINIVNLNLLDRQVETDRIRLDKGQINLSDVAQSESSLAESQANVIQAESNFLTSKLNYENIIGLLPDFNLLDKKYIFNLDMPINLETAIQLSKKKNPDLIIARLEYDQSEKDKIIARSNLVPSASLSFDRSYSEDLSATIDEREKDTLKATITWPFFSGGKNLAGYKKNESLSNRKRLLLDNTTKKNQTDVATAWSNFKSSKSLLSSVQSQVKAAEIANEGITAEYNSGAGRTTLEVIQSNSFLLKAQISLATSERNYKLSEFNLLKSIGLLNNSYLKIK